MRWLTFCLAPFAWLYLLASLVKKKHRLTFLKRVGVGFPKMSPCRRSVWVHAVSVGETVAIAPLAKRLLKEGHPLLISSVTYTGHQRAKELLESEGALCVYLPFDFPFLVKRAFKRVPTKTIVVAETDLWPNFLAYGKKQGAKILVANGKISARSFGRLKKLAFVARALYGPIDHFCVQGALYAKRFLALGVQEKQITITGNLKLATPPLPLSKEQQELFKKHLFLAEKDFVFTLGSTHAPEEALFLEALPPLLQTHKNLKLLIAPRHPERFLEVQRLLEQKGVAYSLYSNPKPQAKVILVDKLGVLCACYALSDLAFVGGSFTKKVGGHNLAEPAFFKVPFCFGPFMHAQPELAHLLLSHKGGVQLTQKGLVEELQHLITHQEKRAHLVANSQKALAQEKKGLETTYKKVVALKEGE